MCKDKNPWADYVGYDLFGYEYNCKYPPSKEIYGDVYGGYSTSNRQTFFYDFCILLYGVAFYYEGNNFEAEFTENGPILTNLTTNEKQGPFENAVDLLEKSIISDKKLIDILDNIECIVLH